MSQNCTICLCPLDSEAWTLPCTHKFHKNCIVQNYKANKNKYDEFTLERLTPTCPICRRQLHQRHLPPGSIPPSRRSRLLQEPAHSRLPPEQRPVRLTRHIVLIQREERQRLLDNLVAQRERLLRRREAESSSDDSQPIRQGPRRRPPVILESSSSSSSQKSVEIFPPPSPPEFRPSSQEDPNVPRPTYSSGYIQSPAVRRISGASDRSRSPVSPAGSQVLQGSPVGSSPLLQGTSAGNSPVLQASTSQDAARQSPEQELQEVQMQIGILRNQLNAVPPSAGARDAPIEIDDNESVLEDDGEERIFPMQIVGRTGRGRHTQYRIRWSDMSLTINRTREVEEVAPHLLADYRREGRTQNVRNFRERQKAERNARR